MDRTRAATIPVRRGGAEPAPEATPLPSRAGSLDRLRELLRSSAGPVLLTGDAGAGKTWLLQRLRESLPNGWRWADVDLSPAVDAVGFYGLLCHRLGLGTVAGVGEARSRLDDFLRDQVADGARWVLAVEECQAAHPAVLEEVRVLGNRLGEPGGLAGIVLSGQTPLVRRFSMPALAPLASRLACHVHLLPWTVDELRTWVDRLGTGAEVDPLELERLHRQSGGNARDLRRALAALTRAPARPSLPAREAEAPPPLPVEPAPIAAAPVPVAPVVAQARPPLQLGEGVVEVGWDAGAEEEVSPATFDPGVPEAGAAVDAPVAAPPATVVGDEVVNDHYAALQAWTEWARNQDREPVAVGDEHDAGAAIDPADVDQDERADRLTPIAGGPSVWAEGQQGFAPYSQLFTRLKQSRDAH